MTQPKTPLDLYELYPEQFPKNAINCNMGWMKIIYDMCASVQFYLDYEGEFEIEQVQFIEIKEKFGVLDITYTGGDNITDKIIKFCEQLSWKTCSICGEGDATLFNSTKWRNWGHGKTLCEAHAVEMFYYRLS